jgi:hypothetical protein
LLLLNCDLEAKTPLLAQGRFRFPRDEMELGGLLVSKEVRQSEAAQLPSSKRATSDQHAESLPIFALIILDGIIIVFVSIAEKFRDGELAHFATA